MKRLLQKQDGFSLVELMVAMVVMSVGFLAMSHIFMAAMEHSKQGKHDMAALSLANEILERVRATPYEQVYATYDGMTTTDLATIPSEARNWATHAAEEMPHGEFNVEIYKNGQKSYITENGILEVEVLASWQERGNTRTMRTSTFIVRMGS
ncbi:MAG: type IV pilus modification protein PilV [Gemmatimonadetes bacterium]|nr:type IV pilus modification protein PilV [Gemmatimonadota bacterium]